jgi:DNA-binding NarL/FixJ family response regulator
LKTRLFRLIPVALLIAGIAGSSLAQDAPVRRRPSQRRFPVCLLVLDLTAEQRTEVHAILTAAWPELRVRLTAVATSGEVLRAALQAEPADACTVGEAALDVEAALQAVRDGRDALKAQLAAVLTPDQLARFEGCLDAPFGDGGISGLAADDVQDVIAR